MSSTNISNDVDYTKLPADLVRCSIVPTVTKVFLKESSLLHFKLIAFSLLLWCIEHLFIPVFFAGTSCSNFGILFSNVLIPFSIVQCAALGVCKTGRKESCRKKIE